MKTSTTKTHATQTRYVVEWKDAHGAWQLPGCTEREATCATREEAEAAIESLRETGEWDGAEFRVRETS